MCWTGRCVLDSRAAHATLVAGDSAYYEAELPHLFAERSHEQPLRILCVDAPPNLSGLTGDSFSMSERLSDQQRLVRTEFPAQLRMIENTWIPLSDGCRLAARIWLPEDAEESRSSAPRSTSHIGRATGRRSATPPDTRTLPGTDTPRSASTFAVVATRKGSSEASTSRRSRTTRSRFCVDLEATVVDRRMRHVRHLVGRIQRPAGRRAASTGTEGDHQHLRVRRSLRR